MLIVGDTQFSTLEAPESPPRVSPLAAIQRVMGGAGSPAFGRPATSKIAAAAKWNKGSCSSRGRLI
jgi:hypothetical protein